MGVDEWVMPMGGMDDGEVLDAGDLDALLRDTFQRAGFAASVAGAVASSVVATEQAGFRRLGLGLVAQMIEHARCGRVNPAAEPRLAQREPAILEVDAGGGFSCPALSMATAPLADLARRQGIACLVLRRAYPLPSLVSLRRALSRQHLSLLARIEGLVPRAGPNGAVFLEIAPVTVGLPRGGQPDLPWPHQPGTNDDAVFEGPVGDAFCQTHRIIAMASAHWPAEGSAPAEVEDSGIAIPACLLEKIINA